MNSVLNSVLTTEERPRKIKKKTVGSGKLKCSRQRRLYEIRRLKRAKKRSELGPDGAANSGDGCCNIWQLEEDHGLKSVVKTLVRLEDSTAQAQLKFLCCSRPYELEKAGALSILTEGLKNDVECIKNRAIECLAKLVGVNIGVRHAILHDDGARVALKQYIESATAPSLRLNCLHLMTGVLSHPEPPMAVVNEWKDVFTMLVIQAKPRDRHLDVVVQASVAILHISNCPDVAFDKATLGKLVTFLGYQDSRLWNSALLTLGNAVSRSTDAVQVALEAGVLQHIQALVLNPLVQESTCYLLTKIAAAGTPGQVKMLFKPSFIQTFKCVAELVCSDYHFNVKTHALAVIVEVIKNCRDCQLMRMDDMSCWAAVCEGLYLTTEASILKPVLEALISILDVSASISYGYRQQIESRGVIEKLVELQGHPNRYVGNMCVWLLDKYFGTTKDDDSFDSEADVPRENVGTFNQATQRKEKGQADGGARASEASFGIVNTRIANT